jgi:hypothetical protein
LLSQRLNKDASILNRSGTFRINELRKKRMAFAQHISDYGRTEKTNTGLHVDFSALRHLVGMIAVSFSGLAWYGVLHFAFQVV